MANLVCTANDRVLTPRNPSVMKVHSPKVEWEKSRPIADRFCDQATDLLSGRADVIKNRVLVPAMNTEYSVCYSTCARNRENPRSFGARQE
jgi:hypothetical protein